MTIEAVDAFPEANPALPTATARKNWHAAWRYSFGAEYKLDENWSFQVGWTYDGACYDPDFPDTMCPPGARNQYGLGVQYATGAWTFGLDYMLVRIRDTDRTIGEVREGVRNARTDTVGFTVGCHL